MPGGSLRWHNAHIAAIGDTKMSKVSNAYDHPISDDLFGRVDYYEALFGRCDLIKREGEFRSYKLGLILDILRTMDMPENLKASLEFAILESWRLEIPEKTIEHIHTLQEENAWIFLCYLFCR
jgi:hypothetical protein